MSIATATLSVSHAPDDSDRIITIAYRPTDPLGLTLVEIEDDAELSPVERLLILTETATRLQINISDFQAAMLYDRAGLVGYRLNGRSCCVACALRDGSGERHGVAHPHGGAAIRDMRPIYRERIICARCGQPQPWVPRLIAGGRAQADDEQITEVGYGRDE